MMMSPVARTTFLDHGFGEFSGLGHEIGIHMRVEGRCILVNLPNMENPLSLVVGGYRKTEAADLGFAVGGMLLETCREAFRIGLFDHVFTDTANMFPSPFVDGG